MTDRKYVLVGETENGIDVYAHKTEERLYLSYCIGGKYIYPKEYKFEELEWLHNAKINLNL